MRGFVVARDSNYNKGRISRPEGDRQTMLTIGTGISPIETFALIGALGIGAQWLAWRLNLPAIVLMLVAGLIVGPGLGLFIPERDIGPLVGPMISVAVAVILFEGGLTLNLRELADAAKGVRRLVIIGAPLGWLLSTLALHFAAGLGWEAASVFGGIMVVTGPTVIAPLLRQAKIARRPAALLQWEAIVNDPVGALAAVLAFGFVTALYTNVGFGAAMGYFSLGIFVATILGYATARGIAITFSGGAMPEFLKVPILFAVLLVVFALSDLVMHESGLLAVTVMGLVLANSNLASYGELRRFKEHATVLLVSGVFILLAAGIKVEALAALDLRSVLFVAVVILVVRPLTVFISLIGTSIPWNERVLVALTGPRGVVLMAVAGLFGERLASLGLSDGDEIGPLAFMLVAATVVIHGFSLKPLARLLGLSIGDTGGVLMIGGSRFTTALGLALQKIEVPVMVADQNLSYLRRAREAGLPVFYGDILSEAADSKVELLGFSQLLSATDNDAYNTLVTTDLGPEFGRHHAWQTAPQKGSQRHALPASLGGRQLALGMTADALDAEMIAGWRIATTRLTDEFGKDDWREKNPEAKLLALVLADGTCRFVSADEEVKPEADMRLISLAPPQPKLQAQPKNGAEDQA